MGFRKLTPFSFNQSRRNKNSHVKSGFNRLYTLDMAISFEGLYYCMLRILHNSLLSDVACNVRSERIITVM